MSKLKSVILALSMLLVAPAAVHAAEITLVPAIKLQIGDRDNSGNYWDGGRWRDREWWGHHYDWRDNRWHPHHDEHRYPQRYYDDRGPDRDWHHR